MSGIYQIKTNSATATNPNSNEILISIDLFGRLFTKDSSGNVTVYPISGNTGTDVFVTGGTYNSSASTITFTNNTGGTFTVTGISGGTGSTSPAGSDTQVQFNDGGSFGASTGFTFSTLSGNSLSVNSTATSSGITSSQMGFSVGSNQLTGLESGIFSFYQNSTSPVLAPVSAIGDLRPFGLEPLSSFNGIFNFLGGSNGVISITGGTRMVVNDPLANVSSVNTSIIEGTEMYYSSGSSNSGVK